MRNLESLVARTHSIIPFAIRATLTAEVTMLVDNGIRARLGEPRHAADASVRGVVAFKHNVNTFGAEKAKYGPARGERGPGGRGASSRANGAPMPTDRCCLCGGSDIHDTGLRARASQLLPLITARPATARSVSGVVA
jgi:hypothetical protein